MYTTREVSCMLTPIIMDFISLDFGAMTLTSLNIGEGEYTHLVIGEADIIHLITDLHTGAEEYTHLTTDLHITEEVITDRIIAHTIEIMEIIITVKEESLGRQIIA